MDMNNSGFDVNDNRSFLMATVVHRLTIEARPNLAESIARPITVGNVPHHMLGSDKELDSLEETVYGMHSARLPKKHMPKTRLCSRSPVLSI